MKPILVIIAPRWSLGENFARENDLAERYDWRVVFDEAHLLGYHGIEYWDCGGADIPTFALDHFKAFNKKVILNA